MSEELSFRDRPEAGPARNVWRAEIVATHLETRVAHAEQTLRNLRQAHEAALWELKDADTKDHDTIRCADPYDSWVSLPKTLCIRREGHEGNHRTWNGNKIAQLQWTNKLDDLKEDI